MKFILIIVFISVINNVVCDMYLIKRGYAYIIFSGKIYKALFVFHYGRFNS